MEKTTRKFIIIQIIIAIAIILPLFVNFIVDWYLHRHLVPTHSLGDFLYNNSFATWVGGVRDFNPPNDSFMWHLKFLWNDFLDIIYNTPYNISKFIFHKRGVVMEIIGFLLIIPFWLTIIDSIYFLSKKIRKVYFIKE